MGTEVFLDTSIPVSVVKGPRFRKAIASFLEGFRFRGISSYSKLEYGNVILSAACLLLRTIARFGSLRDAQEWFANCMHPRSGGRRTWAFNLLVGHCGSDETELTERARLSLQSLLRLGTKRVDLLVHHVEDGTKCVWANRGVVRSRKGLRWETPRCRRDRPRCGIVGFFEKYKSIFKRIRDRIRNLDPKCDTEQLSAFAEVIDDACRDASVLLDYAVCRRLADALIAVDSRHWGHFFTQNRAESIVLCEVLGQHLHCLSSNFTKPVEHHDFSEGHPP